MPPATLSGYASWTTTSEFDGLSEVGDGGQRLVVDVHQLDGVLGDVPALGDDESDRVADELHLALGQRRAGVSGMSLPTTACQASLTSGLRSPGGEHGAHTGQGEGRGGVDAVDLRPGERAAHEAGVQHSGPDDVVDEGATAGEKAVVLDARVRGCPRIGSQPCQSRNHSLDTTEE